MDYLNGRKRASNCQSSGKREVADTTGGFISSRPRALVVALVHTTLRDRQTIKRPTLSAGAGSAALLRVGHGVP